LGAIRAHYLKQLSDAVRETPGQVEPRFQIADGALDLQGALALPGRADILPADGEPLSVDANSRLTFDPLEVKYLSCVIRFEPFTWDWATVIVHGVSVADLSPIVKEWFYRWFDPEDRNVRDPDGLLGVVHFASDPIEREGGVETTVDLGSAPTAALQELVKTIAERGATRISVV